MCHRKKIFDIVVIVLIALLIYRGLIYKSPSDNKPLFIELGSQTDIWKRLSGELTAHPYVPVITVTWSDGFASSSYTASAVYNRKKGIIEERTSGSGPEGLSKGHYVFSGVTDDMIHAAAADHKGFLEIVEYGCKHRVISQTLTDYPESKKAR